MLTTVKSAFLDHPRAVDESYMQHMIFAIRFSGRLFLAALAALVHAVFPFLFEKTASRMIGEMYAQTRNRGVAPHGLDGHQTHLEGLQ
jgi:hypothetical protein